MRLALLVGCVILGALLLMIAIEVLHQRHLKRRPVHRATERPRRHTLLEDAVRPAFRGPIESYGAIFASYVVWIVDREVHLAITTTPAWRRLSTFTRQLIVRHLWRAIEALRKGSKVIVDQDHVWSHRETDRFNDGGQDPWREVPATPIGTLVSNAAPVAKRR